MSSNVSIWSPEMPTPDEFVKKVDLASTAEGKGAAMIGFIQEGTGAVPRTVQDKLRDEVSVKDFGAVGDGVTDDTAAIQSALNSANTNNSNIYIPAGTYLVSNSLSVMRPHNNTTGFGIIGDGRGRSILKYAGNETITSLLEIIADGYSVNNLIEGIKIDLTGAPGSPTGLRIADGVWRSTFRDIYVVRDTPNGIRVGKGIHVGSTAGAGVFDNKFFELFISKFDTNFYAEGNSASGNTITNLCLDSSYISEGRINLYASWFNGLSLNNTQLEAATEAGAHFVEGYSAVITGGSVESNVSGAKGITMDVNTKSVIALCDFFNNSGGHFISNGRAGHLYRAGESGVIHPLGSELRLESDGVNSAKLRFFRNGVADIQIKISSTGDRLAVCKSDGTEQFIFDVTNRRFLISNGSLLMPNSPSNPTPGIFTYHGSPEGNVVASPGSICLDSTGGAGTSIWVKESGTGDTGWVSK